MEAGRKLSVGPTGEGLQSGLSFIPGKCGRQSPEPVLQWVHFWLSNETTTEYLMFGLRGEVRFSCYFAL